MLRTECYISCSFYRVLVREHLQLSLIHWKVWALLFDVLVDSSEFCRHVGTTNCNKFTCGTAVYKIGHTTGFLLLCCFDLLGLDFMCPNLIQRKEKIQILSYLFQFNKLSSLENAKCDFSHQAYESNLHPVSILHATPNLENRLSDGRNQ